MSYSELELLHELIENTDIKPLLSEFGRTQVVGQKDIALKLERYLIDSIGERYSNHVAQNVISDLRTCNLASINKILHLITGLDTNTGKLFDALLKNVTLTTDGKLISPIFDSFLSSFYNEPNLEKANCSIDFHNYAIQNLIVKGSGFSELAQKLSTRTKEIEVKYDLPEQSFLKFENLRYIHIVPEESISISLIKDHFYDTVRISCQNLSSKVTLSHGNIGNLVLEDLNFEDFSKLKFDKITIHKLTLNRVKNLHLFGGITTENDRVLKGLSVYVSDSSTIDYSYLSKLFLLGRVQNRSRIHLRIGFPAFTGSSWRFEESI